MSLLPANACGSLVKPHILPLQEAISLPAAALEPQLLSQSAVLTFTMTVNR